jgi:hypothetical protein
MELVDDEGNPLDEVDHKSIGESSQIKSDEDKKRWISEVAKNQLTKLSEVGKMSRAAGYKKKKNIVGGRSEIR